ncbi:hypothetical protein [Celeribacter sp. SCSIO 80788]|uniref:hypothetical protein n=1 Tax=Celeribacter sp. SCSIO 80788 TaxID=3117013 RepID=UPI003DA4401C
MTSRPKPKLVLHVGMPKTGSSALQNWLAKSRPFLRTQGVLYPGQGKSQSFLSLPLDFEAHGSRLLIDKIGRSQAKADRLFETEWRALEEEIRTTAPSTVVLSTEYLFARLGLTGRETLLMRLAACFSEVQTVVYVRQPSKYFASLALQRVRHSATLLPVAPLHVRTALETWDAAFPGHVEVRTYDRDALVQGDIVADFLTTQLGLTGQGPGTRESVNKSMSAEAAHLMQSVQREEFAGQDNVVLRERNRYRKRLLAADERVSGAQRPKLLPEVAAYLDESSTDLLWLRERYGVIFEALDYERIGERPGWSGSSERIADLFEIDENRLQRLEAAMRRSRLPSLSWFMGKRR